ncbi:MAG: phosphonate metabolism transcriptional regulator PhnF [Thalassobaculales bacterium]
MTLQRLPGVSLWWQIAESLKADIRAGTYRPGDRLPTELELAERFRVNRHTLRRAVAALAERGILRVEQGRGTFVHEDPIDWPMGQRVRFSEIIERQQRSHAGELLRSAVIPAEEAAAKALGIPTGAPVVLLVRLSRVDGRPLSIGDHHFPADRFRGLDAAFRRTGGITAALAEFGVADYLRKRTRITARLPDEAEAEMLEIPRSRPVLVTEAVNVDGDGRPIEFGVARTNSDRLQILVES